MRPASTNSSFSRLGSPPQEPESILVSIVIPVFNSEATIDLLCELLIQELCPKYRLQLVLVNDGSQDASAEICRELHDRHPELIDYIVLSRNFGEHNAVMAGLNHSEGDYCVIMDDDLQNPPGEVRVLIEKIVQGFDVVYVRYREKKHHLFRNLVSRIHNQMAVYALGKPPGLYLSSFKAISRFVVDETIRYTGPVPYLDAIILRTTRNIGVVTADHQCREHGKSGYTPVKLLSLWANMIISFSLYPLRLVGLLGLFMVSVGVVCGLMDLSGFLSPSLQVEGSDSGNAATWFFRGLIVFAISILGEYVGRIYMHLNHTPQFIARQVLGRHKSTPTIPSPYLAGTDQRTKRVSGS